MVVGRTYNDRQVLDIVPKEGFSEYLQDSLQALVEVNDNVMGLRSRIVI